MKEGMRLYPPVWIIPRKAIADDKIGGYTIPAGGFVFLFPYTNHRDSRYWKNATQFIPERFDEDEIHSLPAGCYFPFGIGPRHCIGRNSAPLEVQMILFSTLKKFEISLENDNHPGHLASITLAPKSPIMIQIKRR